MSSTFPLDAANAAVWGYKPAAPAARILKFRPLRNPARTLRGFFSVELASGIVLNDCKLLVGSGGTPFIGMPSVKRRDHDGQVMLDDNGKPAWDQIVEFRDRQARDKFNDLVLAALRRAHPSAFEGAA